MAGKDRSIGQHDILPPTYGEHDDLGDVVCKIINDVLRCGLQELTRRKWFNTSVISMRRL